MIKEILGAMGMAWGFWTLVFAVIMSPLCLFFTPYVMLGAPAAALLLVAYMFVRHMD